MTIVLMVENTVKLYCTFYSSDSNEHFTTATHNIESNIFDTINIFIEELVQRCEEL